jgi:hypothetical protein
MHERRTGLVKHRGRRRRVRDALSVHQMAHGVWWGSDGLFPLAVHQADTSGCVCPAHE